MVINCKRIYIFIVFITGFLPGISWANSDFSLRNLKTNEFKPLEFLQSPPLLIMFFQTDCPACHKQAKEFKCLENLPIKKIFIGSNENEDKLYKEYLHFNTNWPVFITSKQGTKKIGFKQGITPQTLIVGKKRRYHFLGTQNCKQVLKYINKALL